MAEGIKMTRQEMQDQAGIIESLLSVALYMHSERDHKDLFIMIEKAQDRANQLNIALDDVNVPEGMA